MDPADPSSYSHQGPAPAATGLDLNQLTQVVGTAVSSEIARVFEARLSDYTRDGSKLAAEMSELRSSFAQLKAKGEITPADPSLNSDLGWTHVEAFDVLIFNEADVGRVKRSAEDWLRRQGALTGAHATEFARAWEIVRPLLEDPVVRRSTAATKSLRAWRNAVTLIAETAKEGPKAADELSLALGGSGADANWLRVINGHRDRQRRKKGE